MSKKQYTHYVVINWLNHDEERKQSSFAVRANNPLTLLSNIKKKLQKNKINPYRILNIKIGEHIIPVNKKERDALLKPDEPRIWIT